MTAKKDLDVKLRIGQDAMSSLDKLVKITGKNRSQCIRDLIPGSPVLAALASHYENYRDATASEYISLEPIAKVADWLITMMTVACEEHYKIDCQVRILCTGPDRANAAGRLYVRWLRAVLGTSGYMFEQVTTEDGKHLAYFVRGPEDDEGYLRLLRQNMARELQKTSDHIRQITDIFRKHGIPVKDYPAKEVEGTESDE